MEAVAEVGDEVFRNTLARIRDLERDTGVILEHGHDDRQLAVPECVADLAQVRTNGAGRASSSGAGPSEAGGSGGGTWVIVRWPP